MNPERIVFLQGSINHTGANGEIWTLEMEEMGGQGTSNPGAWPRFYYMSNKGYCSQNFRSLVSSLSSMLQTAKNSDFDYKLERDNKL